MMKSNAIILFAALMVLFQNSISAQINSPKYNEMMWNSLDSNSTNTIVPDKWKAESIVVLYSLETKEYRKQSMNNAVNEDSFVRRRVKLMDQTAANSFSELTTDQLRSSNWGRTGNFMGIKIIKPDGSIRIITEDDFVEISTKQSGYMRNTTSKLAIPDLGIGDIIDYYFVSINTLQTEFGSPNMVFDPVFQILQEEYPVVYGKLIIKPERKTYFNSKSLNGAPEPIITKRGKWKSYEFVYGNLERAVMNQMVYPLREYPTIIYQLIIASESSKQSSMQFLGEHGEIKSTVSEDEVYELLQKLTAENLCDDNAYTMLKVGIKDLQIMNKIGSSNKEIAENIFYFARHYLNFKTTNYYGYSTYLTYLIDDFSAIRVMSLLMKKHNIDHQLGLAAYRQLANFDDVIVSSQLIPFIRLYDDDSTILIKPATNSVFGEPIHSMEGSSAIVADREKLYHKQYLKHRQTLKVSETKENYHVDSIFINLKSLRPANIEFKEIYRMTGVSKNTYSPFVVPDNEIYNDEYNVYKEYNTLSNRDISFIKDLQKQFAISKNDYYAQRHFMTELKLQALLDVDKVNLDTIVVQNQGRWSSDDTLKYSYEYSIEDGISKAANYYVVDLGRFIGRNREIKKDDFDTTVNIHEDSPHIIKWVVVMEIPDGYKVEGIEELSMNKINECGRFKSVALIEDNKLIVDISKVYLKNYYLKEEWPQMLEFLNAAVEFTQKQILLSPK